MRMSVLRDGWAIDCVRFSPPRLWGLNIAAARYACVVFMVCLGGVAFGADYGGGSGSAENPYQIWDANDLNEIGLHEEDWDKHFIMMSDVDMSGFDGQDGRPAFNPIGYYVDIRNRAPFSGVFDGNGKKVFNLYLSSEVSRYVGIFAYGVGYKCVIKNFGLINPVVIAENSSYVGSLAGSFCGQIHLCYSQGGRIEGKNQVGGLVGRLDGAEMDRCYSTSEVLGSGSVGGLLGSIIESSIDECFARGNVTGNSVIGGFVGGTYDSIIGHSYATGDATGQERVGGFFGYCSIEDGTAIFEFCFASGLVSGSALTGGMGGEITHDCMFGACYWDTGSTGQSGGVGAIKGVVKQYIDGLYDKVTAEMYSSDTYKGWGSCDVIWNIAEGKEYPHLLWEGETGTNIVTPNYWTGSGTASDPYRIYTSEQLVSIGWDICAWDKHFKLMNNIYMDHIDPNDLTVLGSELWDADYTGVWDAGFTGVFDGSGYTIFDLTIFHRKRGFFDNVDGGGVIRNVNIENPFVYRDGESRCMGVIVGVNKGIIENCHVRGGEIISSGYNTGTIAGSNYHNGVIRSCSFEGSCSSDDRVGGISGSNYGTIEFCRTSGVVSGETFIGGLVGINFGVVFDSYSWAHVSGDAEAGGLIGQNKELVERCYSTGPVSGGTPKGGLIGSGEGVEFCYWDVESSGVGLAGDDIFGAVGKTTEEMMALSTFVGAGWDFVSESENGVEDVWRMCVDGVRYPRLAWEYSCLGDFVCGDGVGFEDLVYFADRWLVDGEGGFDFSGFGVMAEHWLED